MTPRARRIRFAGLRDIGCDCCGPNPIFGFQRTRMHVEVHHHNAGGLHGGKRLGDEFTTGRCEWHHRAVLLPGFSRAQMTARFGPSWAGGSKPFRSVYGTDADLLAKANAQLRMMFPNHELCGAAA